MALVNLQTNLKSLRYGKDRIGGGSSNQPYIKSDIPDGEKGLGRKGGPDFLLRGGLLTPGRAVNDVSRLTQMFFDFKSPNGLLFTAKQNILSRTAVATQASGKALNEGIYLPTSTLLQAAGNPLGIHLNKQGLDPTKRTGPDGGGSGLLNLPSNITDPLGLPVYNQKVTPKQIVEENRLVQLSLQKIGKSLIPPPTGNFYQDLVSSATLSSNIVGSISENNISLDENQILKYSGGPGSTLGIGSTIIKRYSNTNDGINFEKNPEFKLQNFVTLDSNQISSKISSKYNNIIQQDFRKELVAPNKNISNIPTKVTAVDYTRNNIEIRVNLGDPGKKKNKSSYYSVGKPLDKINALPLYKSEFVIKDKVKNDLVKFRIGVIDNDNPKNKTYIHFRAFIDDMSDSYTSEWKRDKMMGRGENFYRYGGFDRSISLSWTVVAQSKAELIPMYQKLNYLASVCAPDYSDRGYMRGNLITLTVGGYLYEQTGIMESITYTVPQESPWEDSNP